MPLPAGGAAAFIPPSPPPPPPSPPGRNKAAERGAGRGARDGGAGGAGEEGVERAEGAGAAVRPPGPGARAAQPAPQGTRHSRGVPEGPPGGGQGVGAPVLGRRGWARGGDGARLPGGATASGVRVWGCGVRAPSRGWPLGGTEQRNVPWGAARRGLQFGGHQNRGPGAQMGCADMGCADMGCGVVYGDRGWGHEV